MVYIYIYYICYYMIMIYPIFNGFTKQLKTGGNQLVQHHKHRIMGSNQEVTGNSHANMGYNQRCRGLRPSTVGIELKTLAQPV